jgi:hypothetical protein
MATRIAEDAIVPLITRRELPKSTLPTRAPIAVYRPATGATAASSPYVIPLQHEHSKDGDPSHQLNPQPTPLLGADHPDTGIIVSITCNMPDTKPCASLKLFVLMPHFAWQYGDHKADSRLQYSGCRAITTYD